MANRKFICTGTLELRGVVFNISAANEDEARALFQRDDSYENYARELAGFGGIAAVKMGGDGAWIAHGQQLHRIKPVRAERVEALLRSVRRPLLAVVGRDVELAVDRGGIDPLDVVQQFGADASLELADNQPGTRATLRLPLETPA